MIDPTLQGLPRDGDSSGRSNLSYVTDPSPAQADLKVFQEIVRMHRVVLVVDRTFYDVVPALRSVVNVATDDDLELTVVAAGVSVAETLAAFPPDIDGVYLAPMLRWDVADRRAFYDGLIAKGLPSFSMYGNTEVGLGALASQGTGLENQRLARRLALNIQRVLLGENAGDLPVRFIDRPRLTINMQTARAIGVSPRWEMLIEADLLNPDPAGGLPVLKFGDAVHQAVEANLDLVVERLDVAAGAEDVARARAALRPQLSASLQGVGIDDDRASPGVQAERTLSGGLSLSQVLYSEATRGNVAVQRALQEGRIQGLETLRLDIALDTAVAYLNLLRAETLRGVQRNNLDLTRSNLDRARVRREIGSGSPAEVFRWQSQIASDRQALINAQADVAIASIAVNRLLHRPLETAFATALVDVADPTLITGQSRIDRYIDTPKHFEVLRAFSVQEGLSVAPELAQLRTSIAAQERQLLTARRAFWSPEISAAASLDELLADGGAGSGSLPGGPDDTTWSISLGASLPLFQGGARRAARTQAEITLERLRHQYDAIAESIEQRIRSASLRARASFTAIELSRQGADASRANLDLVADAYARGSVSIIDLVDAQNAALNADQNAANAVYDFLIDLMEVQRAAGRFDFFISLEAREAWYQRLEAFFAASGVIIDPPSDGQPGSPEGDTP